MAENVTIANGSLSAEVSPHGAELQSIRLAEDEFLWQGNATWWPRRSPVLFPIVGSLRGDNALSAAGKVSLKRHGLARTLDHTIVSSSEDDVRFELVSTEETHELYPYDFRLNVSYAVHAGTLEERFDIVNTGTVALPYAVGGHPAFNVPTPQSENDFSSYRLEFARPWTYATPRIDTKTGLLDFSDRLPLLDDSDTLALTHALFSVDTLVFEDVPECTVTLLSDAGHGIEVSFEDFQYLGVWSAAHDAPFVALEPWTGCATATDEDDVFEHKRGMSSLAPGETASHTFTIRPF